MAGKRLEGLLDIYVNLAQSTLAWDKLPDDARKVLAGREPGCGPAEILASATTELERLFDTLPESAAAHYRQMLFCALSAAWTIVEYGVASDSGKTYFNHKRTGDSRDAKALEDSVRQSALDASILACVANDLSRLNSYIDKMTPSRDDVVRVLSKHGDSESFKSWPSKSTIQKRIAALKKSSSGLTELS